MSSRRVSHGGLGLTSTLSSSCFSHLCYLRLKAICAFRLPRRAPLRSLGFEHRQSLPGKLWEAWRRSSEPQRSRRQEGEAGAPRRRGRAVAGVGGGGPPSRPASPGRIAGGGLGSFGRRGGRSSAARQGGRRSWIRQPLNGLKDFGPCATHGPGPVRLGAQCESVPSANRCTVLVVESGESVPSANRCPRF